MATGHNLDDEAAVLFGNVLRWATDYLGRQLPVLPASAGFVRKVKPLVRLGERETAAYCVLRGIDYIVEECPMAVGNKHLGYKEALNAIEDQSPGTKSAFYFGFLDRVSPMFTPAAREEQEGLRPCAQCGAPTTGEVCAFCKLVDRAARGRLMALMTGPFRAGERVLLVDTKQRRYLVLLVAGGEFHTHAGVTAHDDLIGREEGVTVRSSSGARYTAMRPTLADFVLKMPAARR